MPRFPTHQSSMSKMTEEITSFSQLIFPSPCLLISMSSCSRFSIPNRSSCGKSLTSHFARWWFSSRSSSGSASAKKYRPMISRKVGSRCRVRAHSACESDQYEGYEGAVWDTHTEKFPHAPSVVIPYTIIYPARKTKIFNIWKNIGQPWQIRESE